MNKSIIIGRLTRDPESKVTNDGVAVCTFTVAVSRKGEGADFIPVVTWRKTAEACGKYLSKGKQVGVCGSIHTRSYDVDGVKRYVTEIIADEVEFLGSKEEKKEYEGKFGQANSDFFKGEGLEPIDQEDLPF